MSMDSTSADDMAKARHPESEHSNAWSILRGITDDARALADLEFTDTDLTLLRSLVDAFAALVNLKMAEQSVRNHFQQ